MPFNRHAAMRAVHALGAKHGYSHDDLRDLAASYFGIDRDTVSLGKLTDTQLGDLCATLKGDQRGPQPTAPNKATKRQLWKINQLAAQLGMTSDPRRLAGFCERQVKKRNISDLTKKDAVKVIDGLKNIVERGSDTHTHNG